MDIGNFKKNVFVFIYLLIFYLWEDMNCFESFYNGDISIDI